MGIKLFHADRQTDRCRDMTKAPEKLNTAIIMLCLMAFYTLKAYRIILARRGNRGERLNYAHTIDKKDICLFSVTHLCTWKNQRIRKITFGVQAPLIPLYSSKEVSVTGGYKTTLRKSHVTCFYWCLISFTDGHTAHIVCWKLTAHFSSGSI